MPRLDANPPINFAALFFKRWLMSATLIFGSYNPSGTSYYHWATATPGLTPVQAFTGILLLGLVVAFFRTAYLSIGYVGAGTVAVLITMSIILAVGLGLVDFDHVAVTTYMIELWITIVLAVGVGWAFLQRRISGERDILRSPP